MSKHDVYKLKDKRYYYMPTHFPVKIQTSHAEIIRHDGKKSRIRLGLSVTIYGMLTLRACVTSFMTLVKNTLTVTEALFVLIFIFFTSKSVSVCLKHI